MARRRRPRLADRHPRLARASEYAQFLALRLVSTVLHCLPLETAMRLAAGVGDVMYLLDGKHRRRALDNLRDAFPGQSDAYYRRLTRDSFRLLPFIAVEFMLAPRYVKLERLRRHFVLGDLGDVLRTMVEQKSGVILVTGHYGNWEVMGYMMAVMGFETSSVARTLDNRYINAYVLGVREKKGQRILDKRGAIKDIPPVLDAKGAVGFIADQDAGPKGMFVDYFGKPASTYKSIGLMAMRYDAPVVVGFGRRLGYDFRFRVDVQDVIRPDDWKTQPDPLRYITTRYTKAIEASVRGEPGQYLWLHRRWKTRPPEPKPEPLPPRPD